MQPALSLQNVSHAFGENRILQSVSLGLEQGHYFAIAGVNGAGKSTLIKIILDLIRPESASEITLFGQSNRLPECRSQLAYLPERFSVKKRVSGWQYLQFVASVFAIELDAGAVETLLQQFDFPPERLRSDVSEYSKGMMQKLGLISCFVLERKLLILDEPLSGLDPKARYHFKAYLEATRSNDRTLFYSTHMLADAEEICDRFAILHDGEIRFIGTPDECMQRYRGDTLEKAYMNCVTAVSG